MMCVNGDYTVYFNALTQYGMYATHCIIWYLVETVESFNTLSHVNFKIPKYIMIVGLLYVVLFENFSNPTHLNSFVLTDA